MSSRGLGLKPGALQGKGHIVVTECNFMCLAPQPTNHFEKLLEETCPNHTYPVRHQLNECSMMKNYMTTWALAKGKKPEGDLGGKAATPFPKEEAVMSIYSGPIPHESQHKLKLMSRAVNVVSPTTLEYF
jgi:hypothetical protein